MSIRRTMIDAASRAVVTLGDSAELLEDFVNSQLSTDGGFYDRAGKSDLYYTVFGIESMMALSANLDNDRIAGFVNKFDYCNLDLVHAASLVRCLADLNAAVPEDLRRGMIELMDRHRTDDGGFSQSPDSKDVSMYSCFLAFGAYQDIDIQMPDADKFLSCINSLRTSAAGFANYCRGKGDVATVPATAAALVLLDSFGDGVDDASVQWMVDKCYVHGGFKAAQRAPIPDLLSTATALHALCVIGTDISHIKQPCLDFVDSLWNPKGSFAASFLDDMLDCEYTYYGLLAIGHLSG